MRILALLSLLFASSPRRGIVVEEGSPIVGADRVTTEALGVETLGGVFTPLIKEGTPVPCSVSEVFSTAADGQSQIIVSLFRGTEPMAARNHRLGRFQVVKIPSAPRGVPQVEITFSIDERSISLAARDLARGTEMKIVKLADREP